MKKVLYQSKSHFEGKKIALRIFTLLIFTPMLAILFGFTSKAASYSSDWRDWRQKQSDYATMRSGGCRIVSYAKLLKATGLVTDPNFNPDELFRWCAANGKVASLGNVTEQGTPGEIPILYAKKVLGKTITQKKDGVMLSGDNATRRNTAINYSKQGYYVIVCGPNHFSYVDEERTRSTGNLWVDDSGYGVTQVGDTICGYSLQKYQRIRIFTAEAPTPQPDPEPTPSTPTGSRMASGYSRTLPDGDYIIANAANQKYYLDIEGSSYPATEFQNVHLWHEDNLSLNDYDVWHLKYENGFYTITQYDTGMALDVYYQGLESGTNVDVYYNYEDNDAQLFAISANGRNGYRIQARCNGYSLDIENGNIADNSNVRTCSNNNSDAQSWVFIPYKPAQPISNGRYIITSALNSNLELDVAGDTANIANATNVQIWDDSCQSKYNSFDVEKLNNGYYKLTNAASGKVLDLYGGGTQYNSNICVHDANGSLAQQWAIIPAGSGYALVPRCSGMAMDVVNSSKSNGANVQQRPFNGNNIQANQTWNFAVAEHTIKYDANGGNNAPASQIKYYRNALTITNDIPTRSGYKFAGWKVSKATNNIIVKPGELLKIDMNMILYAHWESTGNNETGEKSTEEIKPGKDESGEGKKTEGKDTKPSDKVETKQAKPEVGDTVVDEESNAYYLVLQTGVNSNAVIYVKSKNSSDKNVTIPADITVDDVNYMVYAIAPNAFKNNTKLRSVTIEKNILSIGKNAFYGCKNLKNIRIKTTSLSKNTVGKNAFKGINTKAKVKVPKSKLKSYTKVLKARGISGKKQTITK
ncbi:RICIN domain-containing protein [Butyrivibrio sp. ob235]|uniref:RICIN domain-containing protein n=1 Tax=Butyrivibrio sp. ob235 TaxID=1761780 RepID=UPI000B807626|nr:RICIN domain-containing protein [Butyrivibrio sp. ob235]